MMRLAEKAFFPAKIPFPVLQVDTGLRLPRGPVLPRPLGQPARRPPDRRQRRGGHRKRRGRRRRQDQPQPHADRHPAQRPRGGRLHRRLRWRPARRGEGPRQGARLLPPRRVRPVGPEDAAPRAVEPLQRPPARGRAHADLPDLNWTELDIWDYLGREDVELPRSTSPTSAGSSSATACCSPRATSTRPAPGETVEERTVRFRTVGDLTLTGCVESTADTIDEIIDEIAIASSPSAARPVATTASPRRPWRTGRRRATSDGHDHCSQTR